MLRPAGDDDVITLRLSRRVAAFALALVGHAALLGALSLLPTPPRREERVEFTLRPPSSPPPATSPPPAKSPPPPPQRTPPPKRTPPHTSPVVPALPPSEHPPENAAVLPVAFQAPDPVAPSPPPSSEPSTTESPSPPSSWKERLLSSLSPPTPTLDTALAPSTSTLSRVANADARLHDDENEERLVVDYGPFFRRGLEALRATWHPDDVLRRDRSDDVRRCAQQTRETRAVAVVDRDGNVVDVQLSRGSGCPGLDGEALAAFRRVGRFPHPPAGLFVDGAGAPASTARLPIRFIVSFDGSVRLDWR